MLFHFVTKFISESLDKSLNIYLYFIPLPRNLTTSLEVIFKVTANLFCIMATIPRLCRLCRLDIWRLGLTSPATFVNVSIISNYVVITNSTIRNISQCSEHIMQYTATQNNFCSICELKKYFCMKDSESANKNSKFIFNRSSCP